MPSRAYFDGSAAEAVQGRAWRKRRSISDGLPPAFGGMGAVAVIRRRPAPNAWTAFECTSPQPLEVGNALQGLKRSPAPNAAFSLRIAARSASVKIQGMKSRFSRPTPCSPVIEPPASTQMRMISSPASSTRVGLAGRRSSKRMLGWRLPSPAWKTLAIGEAVALADRRDAAASPPAASCAAPRRRARSSWGRGGRGADRALAAGPEALAVGRRPTASRTSRAPSSSQIARAWRRPRPSPRPGPRPRSAARRRRPAGSRRAAPARRRG